jgi:serine/threonine protein kinase
MVGQHISKYRVTEQVGRGGMGTVYRAIDETLHREVAIKVLNTELNDPSVARRFRAEAVTVARLNHPGIATIYELVQHEGQWLMVMEFVRGETLEHLSTRKGPLPVEEAADLCMQTLSALAHAHSLGVVHRDLKPANLMVTSSGTVKIMDFGIARVAGSEHLTSAGFMMGTPAYMAPEQVMGHEIDARTDLYATGVVLYHLASGRLPFKGDTPMEMAQSRMTDEPTPVRTFRNELPPWLGQVLEISLEREPERRFQTALMFREALRRGLANLPIETPGFAPMPPELVATAAPRSMPIASPSAMPVSVEIPKSPPPPASDIPTIATVMPAAARSSSPTGARTQTNTKVMVAGGLAVLAVAAVVGLTKMRSGRATPVESASVAVSDPAPSSPIAPVPSDPVQVLGPSVTSTPLPAGEAALPAAASPPAVARGSAAAVPVAPGAAKPVIGPDGRAMTSPGAARADAARGRARAAAAAAEAPASFPDLRAFVVTGKKAEEEPAVLHFRGGQVSLVAEKGGQVFASIPYAELSSASFVRAKNPRWYPTLASPPSGVDMPGGLFRSSRPWLSLQSRSNYLIVRLNDNDFRAVLETITARTGVKVDQVAAQ